jgi:hypothetical protein
LQAALQSKKLRFWNTGEADDYRALSLATPQVSANPVTAVILNVAHAFRDSAGATRVGGALLFNRVSAFAFRDPAVESARKNARG